jgi:3-dehydroquinate synthetase
MPEKDATRIRVLLEKAGLPVDVELSKVQRKNLLQAMMLDKKVSNGEIKFVLARKIGQVQFGCRVPDRMVEDALHPRL